MTGHYCQRCGSEHRCVHGGWTDRHPAATVALAVLVVASISAYPWLVGVGVLGAVAYMIDREQRRRRALAARADYEHAALIAAQARPLPPLRPAAPERWQLHSLSPTKPQPRVRY